MSLLYQHAREFGLELTLTQQDSFEKYFHLLVEWNEKFNLTTITDYPAVQLKHFLDSLAAAPILMQAGFAEKRLMDVGAGAGFPGMALAIAFPEMRVTLLEATGKKVRFLDQVTIELPVTNAFAVHARAEESAHDNKQRAHYDFVVARAVAPMRTLVEYTVPFVRVGGLFIAYRAVDAAQEAKEAQHAMETLGGRVRDIIPVKLADLDDVRHLVVIEKITATPGIYPRAGGLPKHKPL